MLTGTGAPLLEPPAIERVLDAALRRGGDFAEIFAEDRASTGITLDDRKVEELSSGRSRGAGVRVVVGDSTGYAHTADLSEPSLVAAAEVASSIARAAPRDSNEATASRALPSTPLEHRNEVDSPPDEVPKGRKVALLEEADDAARSTGSAIVQVMAGYGDNRRRILVANSDGLLTSDDRTRTRLVVQCVASGDTGMQTGYEVLALTIGFELFDRFSVDDTARTAAERAIAKLSARPAPTGVVPVVIKGGSGGILFHEACGHGLEADHILKDSSVYTGRVGDLVASPLVTLVDDATVTDEWGALAIDDEGHPGQRNVLIDKGVLTDYMWDRLRARKDGRLSSSGNGRRESYAHLPMVRMTNTFISEGGDDAEDIISGTKYGVYVGKLGGGQVNTATGDFVFGMVEAHLIEDGRITQPLRDANLIGNGPDVLSKIDAVAGDFAMSPGTCGKDGQSVPVGCGQPTLRLTGVTIGGTSVG